MQHLVGQYNACCRTVLMVWHIKTFVITVARHGIITVRQKKSSLGLGKDDTLGLNDYS